MKRRSWMVMGMIFLTAGAARGQQAHRRGQVQAAVVADSAPDAKNPPRFVEASVPSHGVDMNGVFYLAAGAGPHPTVLLLHGFPGYEQNIDLAQSIRRAGWNVVIFHYRGSWGSHGDFSFTHAMEDTDAAIAFLRDPVTAAKYGVDPKRIVLIGHSMGGFMALHAAAKDVQLLGVGVISGWNIGGLVAEAKTPEQEKEEVESLGEEIRPLAGCTAEGLWDEIKAHDGAWNFVSYAQAIRSLPVLVLEADDGLAQDNKALAAALRKAGDTRVTELHMATDHAFSGRRIALQTTIVKWLEEIGKP